MFSTDPGAEVQGWGEDEFVSLMFICPVLFLNSFSLKSATLIQTTQNYICCRNIRNILTLSCSLHVVHQMVFGSDYNPSGCLQFWSDAFSLMCCSFHGNITLIGSYRPTTTAGTITSLHWFLFLIFTQHIYVFLEISKIKNESSHFSAFV